MRVPEANPRIRSIVVGGICRKIVHAGFRDLSIHSTGRIDSIPPKFLQHQASLIATYCANIPWRVDV